MSNQVLQKTEVMNGFNVNIQIDVENDINRLSLNAPLFENSEDAEQQTGKDLITITQRADKLTTSCSNVKKPLSDYFTVLQSMETYINDDLPSLVESVASL